MKERLHAVLATVGLVLAGAVTSEVGAQVRGIPVYNSGIPSGIGIYGDVGFPDTEAGKGRALAVSGRAGFGALGVTAMLSTFDPEGEEDSELSVGASLNYRLYGAPLVPLSITLQGGIGYSKPEAGFLPDEDVDELRFPVGLGMALTIPNPSLAIKPWIAPRVDVVKVSGSSLSETESNFGLGGGVELNLLNGFGLQAAYDRVFLQGSDPSVFGFGAHYTFQVPGL